MKKQPADSDKSTQPPKRKKRIAPEEVYDGLTRDEVLEQFDPDTVRAVRQMISLDRD